MSQTLPKVLLTPTQYVVDTTKGLGAPRQERRSKRYSERYSASDRVKRTLTFASGEEEKEQKG